MQPAPHNAAASNPDCTSYCKCATAAAPCRDRRGTTYETTQTGIQTQGSPTCTGKRHGTDSLLVFYNRMMVHLQQAPAHARGLLHNNAASNRCKHTQPQSTNTACTSNTSSQAIAGVTVQTSCTWQSGAASRTRCCITLSVEGPRNMPSTSPRPGNAYLDITNSTSITERCLALALALALAAALIDCNSLSAEASQEGPHPLQALG